MSNKHDTQQLTCTGSQTEISIAKLMQKQGENPGRNFSKSNKTWQKHGNL
jgi:hypothetical protein